MLFPLLYLNKIHHAIKIMSYTGITVTRKKWIYQTQASSTGAALQLHHMLKISLQANALRFQSLWLSEICCLSSVHQMWQSTPPPIKKTTTYSKTSLQALKGSNTKGQRLGSMGLPDTSALPTLLEYCRAHNQVHKQCVRSFGYCDLYSHCWLGVPSTLHIHFSSMVCHPDPHATVVLLLGQVTMTGNHGPSLGVIRFPPFPKSWEMFKCQGAIKTNAPKLK